MEMVFGGRFVHSEWEDILESICEVWEQEEEDSTLHTREIFEELLALRGLSLPPVQKGRSYLLIQDLLPVAQDDDHLTWSSESSSMLKKSKKNPHQSPDLRRFDLGVIDLTCWKDNSDTAEAGPSKILQKRKRSSQSPQPGSRRTNPFLDIYAAQDEEDEEESDTGAAAAGPSQASEVLPTGRITLASRIDDICCCYEGGHTKGAGLHASPHSLWLHSPTLLTSSPEANLHVYKLDIMTGMKPHISPFFYLIPLQKEPPAIFNMRYS